MTKSASNVIRTLAMVLLSAACAAARAETSAIENYIEHCTFRIDFNDTQNPLWATIGTDAVVGEGKNGTPVEGLGSCEIVTDAAATAGLAEGDSAISVPSGQNIVIRHGLPVDGSAQWAVRFRVFTPASSMGRYRSLFYVPGDEDAALFFSQGNAIGGAGQYGSSVASETWYTIEVLRNGDKFDVYKDGVKVHSYASRIDESLLNIPTLLISGDNQGEDQLLYFSSIEFFDTNAYPLPEDVGYDAIYRRLYCEAVISGSLVSSDFNSAVFDWNLKNIGESSESASVYIDIAASADFAAATTLAAVENAAAAANGTLTATGLSVGTQYFARMRSVNSAGYAATNETVTFTTDSKPYVCDAAMIFAEGTVTARIHSVVDGATVTARLYNGETLLEERTFTEAGVFSRTDASIASASGLRLVLTASIEGYEDTYETTLAAAMSVGGDGVVYRPGLQLLYFPQSDMHVKLPVQTGNFQGKVRPELFPTNLLGIIETESPSYDSLNDIAPEIFHADYRKGSVDNGVVTNPWSGRTWGWINTFESCAYEGEIYLPADVTLQSYGRIGDGARVEIDGTCVLDSATTSGYDGGPATKEPYDSTAAGWRPFNAWVWWWNTDDNKGAINVKSNNAGAATVYGAQWNTNGVTDSVTDSTKWFAYKDLGDMAFLRTRTGENFISDFGCAVNGTDIALALSLTNVPVAGTLRAFYGNTDGGAYPEKWAGSREFGAVPAGDSTVLADLGALTQYRYVRLCAVCTSTDSFGLEQWSAPFRAAPSIENPVAKVVEEQSCTFTVDVAPDSSKSACVVSAILTPADGAEVTIPALATVNCASNVAVTVDGLVPGTEYSVRLVAKSSVGAELETVSESVSFTTIAVSYIPAFTVDTSSVKTTGATVSFDWTLVNRGYGCNLTELKLVYGTSEDALTRTYTLSVDTPRGANFLLMRDLDSSTTYFAKIVGTNDHGDGETGESEIFSFTTCAGYAANGARESFVGGDRVLAFGGEGSFTLSEPADVRVLAVGGGGAGGYTLGGGGGGGQVVDKVLTLQPGTYTVSVGHGGGATTSVNTQSGSGGSSYLMSGTDVLVSADGGGAGGNYTGTGTMRFGVAGANGGGASQTGNAVTSTGGAATVIGGHKGGNGTTALPDEAAGGGGGAGEDGQDAWKGDGYFRHGGKGGDGVESDITGEAVYYGGGGGGGAYSNHGENDQRIGVGGDGGKGGGGAGAGGHNMLGNLRIDAESGVDGLGGGGGGGRRSGDTGWTTSAGDGGSGTVIVRFAHESSQPRAAVEVATAGSLATASVRILTVGGGASAADVSLVIDGAGSVAESGLANDGVATGTFANLTPGTTYHWTLTVTGDTGTVTTETGSFKMPSVMSATGGTETTSGSYKINTFTESGTLVVPQGGIVADVLVVGGGGAGGYGRGGGGGAGGLIHKRAVEIPEGTYTVTIGAGGVAVANVDSRGGNGGDTTISCVETGGTEIFRAIGGGGGGAWKNSAVAYGESGGSGGGTTYGGNAYLNPGAGTPGQGHSGGCGNLNDSNVAGGGGGAGGPGTSGEYIDSTLDYGRKAGGRGGDGVETDISGHFTWYAGGGGGGIYSKYDQNDWNKVLRGLGGKGGGGDGAGSSLGYAIDRTEYRQAAVNGTDGLGGGGGGGGPTDDQTNCPPPNGGNGGSGVVIIRYFSAPDDDAKPVIDIVSAEADESCSAKIAWRLSSIGAGADTCRVEARYGVEAGNLSFTQVLASESGVSGSGVLKYLAPGATYYVALYAVNNQGESARCGSLAKVTVPDLEDEIAGGVSEEGLYQAQFDGQKDWTSDIMSAETLRVEDGAAMAYIYSAQPGVSPTYLYTSTKDGVVSEWTSVRTFGYMGYVWLEGGLPYILASGIDDYVIVRIDGKTIVRGDWGTQYASGVIKTRRTGWHRVEVRLGNRNGGVGACNVGQLGRRGLVFQPIAAGTKVAAWNWRKFMNNIAAVPSVRTAPPGRQFSVSDAAFTADGFTAEVNYAAGADGDTLFVAHGSVRGSETDPSAWEHCGTLASLAADGGSAAVNLALGADEAFVRIAAVGVDGNVTWSKTYIRDNFGVPVMGDALDAIVGGDTATVRGALDVRGGDATTVTLYYGTTTNKSEMLSAELEIGVDGSFSKALEDLSLETRYYYWFEATNAGVTDVSDIQTFLTLGTPKVGSFWVDNSDQRTLHAYITVVDVGAAGSIQLNFYGGGYHYDGGIDPQKIVGALTVTEPGDYSIAWNVADDGYDFGDYLRVTLKWSATAGSANYSGRETKDVTVYDIHEYKWTGAAGDGLWDTAGNWDDVTGGGDGAGYPTWCSKVVFPAGCDADVTVSGTRFVKDFTVESATSAEAPSRVVIRGGSDAQIRIRKPTGNNLTEDASMSLGKSIDLTFTGGVAFESEQRLFTVVDEGSTLRILDGSAHSSLSTLTVKDGATVEVKNEATLYVAKNISVEGQSSTILIDDGAIVTAGNWETQSAWLNNDAGSDNRIIFRGTHPRLRVLRLAAYNKSASAPGILVFEVPVGGYAQAPVCQLRTPRDNYKPAFPWSDTTYIAPVQIVISADSPALQVAGTTETDLVDWYDGFNTEKLILPTAPSEDVAVSASYLQRWGTGKDDILHATLAGPPDAPAYSAPDGAETGILRTYGPYEIRTYSAGSRGVFTAAAETEAEVLLVGGGGGGGSSHNQNQGWAGAGGGGAGGFVLTNLTLAAGVYPVEAGLGGAEAKRFTALRPDGRDGSASRAFGISAFGGGGGADTLGISDKTYGSVGGSGGGGYANGPTAGGAGVAGQGNPGGNGVNSRNGGGGGAGSAGKNGNGTSAVSGRTNAQGDGGDGLECDISGRTVWYAGGGGAGGNTSSRQGGFGGKGGGGSGAACDLGCGEAGVDGLGGGGGGAAFDYAAYQADVPYQNGSAGGGKGGDGVIIVKTRAVAADATAWGAVRAVAADKVTADVEWELIELGEGASSATVTFYVGDSAATVTNAALVVEDVTSVGIHTDTVSGLMPGRTYYMRLVAVNDLNVSSPTDRAGDVFTFVTKAETGTAASTLTEYAGLIQGSASGNRNTKFDPAESEDAHVVPGLMMAMTGTGWTDPEDGTTFCWTVNKTFAYTGYMWCEGGKTYSFATGFRKYRYIKLGGTVCADVTDGNTRVYENIFTALVDGWYPIEVRMSCDSWEMGPMNNFAMGLGWRNDGETGMYSSAFIQSEGWNPMVDPGDGSLFRWHLPAGHSLDVNGAIWNAEKTVLSLVVSVSPASSAVRVRACFGGSYGAEDVSAWTSVSDVGTISADASGLSVSLSDLPAKGYLRFVGEVLDADGNATGEVVWSETLAVEELVETEKATPLVTFNETFDIRPCYADVRLNLLSAGTGETTAAIKMVISETEFTADDIEGMAASAATLKSAAEVGPVEVRVNGLLPQRTYYAAFFAENGAGASDPTEIVTIGTIILDDNTPGISTPGVYGGAITGKTSLDLQSFPAEYSTVLSPEKAYTTTGWGQNVTYVYWGYMFLNPGSWQFCSHIDDNAAIYLTVGGEKKEVARSNWSSANIGTPVTIETAGYYPVEFRMFNGTGGAGPAGGGVWQNHGMGYRDANACSGNSFTDGFRDIVDPGDGSLLVPVLVRTIDVTSYTPAADSLAVELELNRLASVSSVPLHVVWGSEHGGDDPSAWQHTAPLGSADKDTETWSYSGGADVAAADYVRFYVDNGEFGPYWSTTIVLKDKETPVINATTIAADGLWKGDKVDISCGLAFGGSGNAAVRAEISRTGDFTDAESWPMVLDEETGVYSVTVFDGDADSVRSIRPGVETYFRIIAACGARSSVSETKSFTTDAAAAVDSAITLSFAEGRILAKSAVTALGARESAEGGCFVRLYGGTDPTDMAEMAGPVPVTEIGEVSLEADAVALDTALYYQIEVSNACATASWTSRTLIGTVTVLDDSVYVWTGGGEDALWTNPANWDGGLAGGLGYPGRATATAQFTNATEATVVVPGEFLIKSLDVATDNLNLFFTSANLETKNGKIKANFDSEIGTNNTIVLNGVTFMSTAAYKWGKGGDAKYHHNHLRLENGATLSISSAEFNFWGMSNTLEVVENSLIDSNGSVVLGGDDSSVLVSDSAINQYGGWWFHFIAWKPQTAPTRVRLEGSHPVLKAKRDFSFDSKDGFVDVTLAPSERGFTEAPIQRLTADTNNDIFPVGGNATTRKFRFSIEWPYKNMKNMEIPVMDWASTLPRTIDTTCVELDDVNIPKHGYWYWTYGTECAAEPSAEGEKPTGLWFHAHRREPLVIRIQ